MVLKKITEVYQLFKAYGAGYSINRMYQRMLNGQKDYYKFWIEKNEIQDPFCILFDFFSVVVSCNKILNSLAWVQDCADRTIVV